VHDPLLHPPEAPDPPPRCDLPGPPSGDGEAPSGMLWPLKDRTHGVWTRDRWRADEDWSKRRMREKIKNKHYQKVELFFRAQKFVVFNSKNIRRKNRGPVQFI